MIVTAYHGTTTRAAHIVNGTEFDSDRNTRPKWLGDGIYFFQDAPNHARQWAETLSQIRGEAPIVFQADIDLTESLDFLDTTHWDYFKIYLKHAKPAPTAQVGPNVITSSQPRPKFLGWNFEDHHHIHQFIALIEDRRRINAVRCPFIEGNQLYANSWFFDEAHVSICVKRTHIISNLTQI